MYIVQGLLKSVNFGISPRAYKFLFVDVNISNSVGYGQ